MRKKILSLVLLLGFTIVGCGSTTKESDSNTVSLEEYKKVVEERDYYKEQYEAITSQQEEANIVKEIEQPSAVDFNYYLDNLSSIEIVNECMSILNNIPQTGMTIEQYESTFTYKPLETSVSELGTILKFAQESNPEVCFPDRNAIIDVSGINIGTQMDGTLAMHNDPSMICDIELNLCITDYETAVAVYDGLLNELSPTYLEVNDRRDGTSWHATGGFNFTPDSKGFVDDIIRLRKLENGFWLYAKKCYPYEQ